MVRDEKLRDTRKECGKLGGNPQLKNCRNQSLDNQNSTTPDNQTSTPSSSISSSSSETKTFARIQPTDVDIQRVYDAYPRKVGSMAAKTAVRRAVARLMRGIDAPAAMLAQEAIDYLADKVQRFARSPAGQQGKFTPHPATWFNDGRYLDDEMEWQKQQVEGRNAAKQGNATRGASVPAAVARQRVSHDAIRAAAARRYGVEPDAAHGRDAGLVPASDAARGNAGFVVGRVGGDRARVWNGDVPGRVMEGDARVKVYT
jgi:hypothetical protein